MIRTGTGSGTVLDLAEYCFYYTEYFEAFICQVDFYRLVSRI